MTNTEEKLAGRRALERKLNAMSAMGLLPIVLFLMPDERQRAVLQLRHGRGMSWRKLRKEAARRGLFYSERHLYRIYAQALASFAALTEMRHEN